VDVLQGNDNLIIINDDVRLSSAEISYRTTRSSGPGGQHLNKTETAVELLFDIGRTKSLTDTARSLAMARLESYIDRDGVLHLESQSERSQLRNREEVTSRFVALLRAALIPVKHRRKTRPSKAVREHRLDQKRRTGQTKSHRQRPKVDD
jgi:ribosome-associated protein